MVLSKNYVNKNSYHTFILRDMKCVVKRLHKNNYSPLQMNSNSPNH